MRERDPASTRPGQALVPEILTPRLRLIPCTLELARDYLDRPKLAERLGVAVGADWPNAEILDFLPRYQQMLERDPRGLGWGVWLVARREVPTLIGDAGFHRPPDAESRVELGYAILPPFRRQGFATEAARALVDWAFVHDSVDAVLAEVELTNLASHAVLKNLGMRRIGASGETAWWELRRPTAAASAGPG